MGYSVKINLRKPARMDGTCRMRLQMILNRDILFVGLDITWSLPLLDEETGKCLTKLPTAEHPDDYAQLLQTMGRLFGPEWQQRDDDHNMLLSKALTRANVFIQACLSRR